MGRQPENNLKNATKIGNKLFLTIQFCACLAQPHPKITNWVCYKQTNVLLTLKLLIRGFTFYLLKNTGNENNFWHQIFLEKVCINKLLGFV